MEVRHVCPLCDYAREGGHATVLDPVCPSCGGILATAGPAAAPRTALPVARLARSRGFERAVTGLVVAPLLLAAAKLGWSAAGIGGGTAALLVAGLAAYVALAPTARRS